MSTQKLAAALPEKKAAPLETSDDQLDKNIVKSTSTNDVTLDEVNTNSTSATAVVSASQTISQKALAAKDEVEWEDVDDSQPDAGVNCGSNDGEDLGSDDYEWITSTGDAPGLAKNDVSATKSYRVENWFEKLFGFNEEQLGYGGTQQSFRVTGDILTSQANRSAKARGA